MNQVLYDFTEDPRMLIQNGYWRPYRRGDQPLGGQYLLANLLEDWFALQTKYIMLNVVFFTF
jgi:hypothetical protein